MPSNISPKDLELVSDGVLDGSVQMDKLPAYAQQHLASYWAQQGVDFADPEMGEAGIQELMAQREAAEGSFLDSPIFKPVEWVGSKLYWLYSNTVSPVVSLGGQVAHTAIYGRNDAIGEDGEWDALKDYWNLSKSVSPGQSIWMLGLNNEELRERGISPDQMAEDKKLALKGEYKDKPTVNDPFGTKTRAEEYFGEGASKYVTGTTDFAVSWYADPLVLLGKGAGAARQAAVVKPVSKELGKAAKEAERAGLGPDAAFDVFAQKPVFQSMVDKTMAIKAANPNNAALVLRRDFPTVAKSANGDALARLLAQAKDADEVSSVLRVSMGDMGGKLALDVKNVKLAGQVDVLLTRNSAAGAQYDALTDLEKASTRGQMMKQAVDDGTAYVNKLNAETRIIDDTIAAFNTVDSMNFNRVTNAVGMKVRGSKAWQEGEKLKPVRGQGMLKAVPTLMYNATVGLPIKVIRSYGDIKPTSYIDIHGENSYKEVDASLREVSKDLLSRGEREALVSSYLKASPNDRTLELVKIEQYTISKMVERHNAKAGPDGQITLDLAKDLYKDFSMRRKNGQIAAAGSQRVYGTAQMADPANPTMSLRVAEFEADGSRMVATPIFDSQLANSHVMMNFGTFERLLNEQGSALQAIKNRAGDGFSKVSSVADTLGQYWKFAQLFRLGYAPRALADDFLGQVARFGGVAMVQRTIDGGKIMASDFYRARWAKGDVEMSKHWAAVSAQQVEELSARQLAIKNNLTRATAKGSSGGRDVPYWQQQFDDVTEEITEAKLVHADMTRFTAEGKKMRDVKIGREVFAPYFGGKQGELYEDLTAGERNFANMMGSQSDSYLRQMRRLDWENITPGTHGADKHMDAWMRHVSDQIANSSVGRQALMGKTEAQIAHWMRSTPEGQAYRNDIGLRNITDMELATRVKAQVDYVMPLNIAGMDAARVAALEGKLDKSMLEIIPSANRPMVNGEQFRYAEGTSSVSEMVDRGVSAFYRAMNTVPAAKLLRNPLFGQQYKARLADQMNILKSQGVTHIDEATRKTMEEGARKAALRDVKKYTFTMDHETKMAYMMRNFGAFFGAQAESWNRWGRIIAEKPQALAHVAQVYGAPARAGIVVDQDGNSVDASGYSADSETGERKLTTITDRKMLIQVPEYLGGKKLNKFLGMDEDASFAVPMSTLELVLNNGDGALPVGVGPYVQLAANNIPLTEWDASGSPVMADWYQKMGILPFGPQDSVMDFINPNTGKKLGDSMHEFSETKQRSMFNMMQVENYKWEQGLRDTQPTWEELEDRSSRWSIFRTLQAFVSPVSINQEDPYQYFRDEFQRMQKLDPESADEKFYEKYGDSFHSFSQSMSKNNTGLRPTQDAVRMSKHYQDLIAKVGPEFAGLIVGAEGDGEFSEGAYYYQKTHSTDPASLTTDRAQMSSREAWDKANLSKGWKQYNSFREEQYAELFDRGLKSFEDPGAEDLQEQMELLEQVLTKDKFPDGTANPYYNKAWEKEFNTLDKGKYDRNAVALSQVVEDPEVWSKAVSDNGTVGIRSEIYTLRTYLGYRTEMQKALILRDMEGGSDDPNAQSNADLKDSWNRLVIQLIEADTKFSSLHSRWFATDMGFSKRTLVEEGELSEESGDLTGTTPTASIFDALEAGAE